MPRNKIVTLGRVCDVMLVSWNGQDRAAGASK